MTRPPLPGPAPLANPKTTEPRLSLRDIVQALLAGLYPNSEGLELMLDRIERMP